MFRLVILLSACLGLLFNAAAQSPTKPWTEWSKKEVEKTLNDSPWGQTQVETNSSESTYTPTISGTTASRAGNASSASGGTSDRDTQGAYNQQVFAKYRIRFLSAKPIRAAVAQFVTAAQTDKEKQKQIIAQMTPFVDRDFAGQGIIVISVDVESNDPRYGQPPRQELASAVAESLKNSTYLERKDGKRLFLADYRAPTSDGLGAKFVFPRMVDGKPFIDQDTVEVRFVAETGKRIRLNMRFKVKEMMYDGHLEY